MSAADKIHVMLLEEARHDIGSKCEGHSAIVFAPAGDVFVWVGPQQVTQQTAVGNLPELVAHHAQLCSSRTWLQH